MDTRTYLGVMKNIDKRIKNKLNEAIRWRTIAEGCSSQVFDNDRVQTSPKPDAIAQAIVNALENERQASEMAERLTRVKTQILSQIDGIENELFYNILYGYYIDCMNLSDLAEQEGYSFRNIRRKYHQALAEFDRKYGMTYKNT